MSGWAKVGVECVCVDDQWSANELDLVGASRVPMRHEVLTISDINSVTGGLQFREIDGTSCSRTGLWTIYWAVHHFRPLITQSDDVAKFTHLLNTQKIEERV